MEENNPLPGKDAKGRFVKGHKLSGGKKRKANEIMAVHPKYPHLDKLGRPLPGTSADPSVREYQGWIHHKRLAIQRATTEEEALELLQDLRQSALGEPDAFRKVALAKLYFDYVLGVPGKETQVTQVKVTEKRNITIDYTKLSDEELRSLEVTLAKATPQLTHEPEIIIDKPQQATD